MTELSKFRKSKGYKSQGEFAKKLGYEDKWSTYAAQERGINPLPPEVKELLRGPKWKYQGPWPDEEDESDTITKEEFDAFRMEQRSEMDAIRREVRQMTEWARREENKEHKALGAALAECLRKLGGGPETPLAELIAPDPK